MDTSNPAPATEAQTASASPPPPAPAAGADPNALNPAATSAAAQVAANSARPPGAQDEIGRDAGKAPPLGAAATSLSNEKDKAEMLRCMNKVTIGRQVRYILPEDSENAGDERTATIVEVLDIESRRCTLNVQAAYREDFEGTKLQQLSPFPFGPVFHVHGVQMDDTHEVDPTKKPFPGTWHFPDYTIG